MLRRFLIYLSKADWARNLVSSWWLAWRTASRFVAGETLDDAIRVVKALNANGVYVTLDHLGEYTNDSQKAEQATKDILDALDAIEREGLSSGVSLKLTQIGLALDLELCADNLACIVERAGEMGVFVRIDMEDSPWIDQTLALYELMRERGHRNVGVVIQAYLFRSETDMRKLAETATPVRLCKGAYDEPHSIAFARKSQVDRNFDRLTEILIDVAKAQVPAEQPTDGRVPPIPAIATHDEARIAHARTYAAKVGLPKEQLEFQMLHGIRRELQEQLKSEGYPLRVYVPYGSEWYPYFMRRLAERPANLWFFLSSLLRG